ncbi:Hypothetical_protein [Hexamita inflata]|uniref:Hypothetical_protein n=1 Tax=Hexamita inflata TaxID=28002 RepID=A0AA86NRT3_9EUKA|nr:Hypothetical protein HINF_LOCUS12049 [Hexamita inflata]
MKLEQLYSESSSERFAFGMDGSGCGMQDPRVSEKLVPSRLRETGILFHCFRLLRPLDFWKESQTPRRLRERAGQHESTMINEYISTNSSAGSLRNGTHLSFHWTLSSNLFWVSFVSTYTHSCPLVRLVRFCFELLVLRVTALSSSLITSMAETGRLQRSSARSTPYFPFPFSLVQAVLQSLSAGVGRLHLQEVV